MKMTKTSKMLLATSMTLSMLPMGAMAASDDGTATATIVIPITITATQDLAFGKINANGGGTVVIATDGSRSVGGGDVALVTTGSVETQAQFTVTGVDGATYAITLPGAPIDIENANNETMSVGTFTSDPNGTGTLTGGTETLNVGGTLTVGAAQDPGDYTGDFTVTVEYN